MKMYSNMKVEGRHKQTTCMRHNQEAAENQACGGVFLGLSGLPSSESGAR